MGLISAHVATTVGSMMMAIGSTTAISCCNSGAGLDGLSGTATAPSPIVARYEMTKWRLLPHTIATRSPLATPRSASPPRSRPIWSRSSPYVVERLRLMIATSASG